MTELAFKIQIESISGSVLIASSVLAGVTEPVGVAGNG